MLFCHIIYPKKCFSEIHRAYCHKTYITTYSNPCRSRKFFTPPQPSPNSRFGSKKFTNDLGLLEIYFNEECQPIQRTLFRRFLVILGGGLLAIPCLHNRESVSFPTTNASEYIDNHPIWDLKFEILDNRIEPTDDSGGLLFTPKNLTVNWDDENPVILKIHHCQGTNATQLLAWLLPKLDRPSSIDILPAKLRESEENLYCFFCRHNPTKCGWGL